MGYFKGALNNYVEKMGGGGHTIYSRNNMRQKCGGNCGLWILHEMIQNKYSENLRKIVGALWELPAK